MEEKRRSIFFFDAVCFKGMDDSLARIDIYVLVPYQTLHFLKSGNQYGASYSVTITAIDTNGNKIKSEILKRNISEEYLLALNVVQGNSIIPKQFLI